MEDTRRHIADTPDMLPALVQVMMVVMMMKMVMRMIMIMMMRMHTTITAANPLSSTTPPPIHSLQLISITIHHRHY